MLHIVLVFDHFIDVMYNTAKSYDKQPNIDEVTFLIIDDITTECIGNNFHSAVAFYSI